MPIDSFDARRIAAMKQAFELSWSEIALAFDADHQHEAQARELLGSLIVELASQGEIDPIRLRDYALRRFTPALAYYAGRVRH